MSEALAGRVIAVAETRELDLFAALLERRGARVLRYPLVQIVDAPDPAPILAWVREFARGGYDDMIFLTGEGLHRLLRCIERHDAALRTPFLVALGAVRKITRGPKPARALRELGLASDLSATVPTTAGVIECLRGSSLQGRRIGVQLYGAEPNLILMEFLELAGALFSSVAPYRYADGAGAGAVTELLARLRAGQVDAIAFTSKAQVERLFAAAPADTVRAALAATNVAAVGPLVAATLAGHGVAVGTVPENSWFMKPLTAALSALLA
ncbi:MAG TPA: uroporphyrinogen-III synthase [Steroidobacteraceae bacterium]|jgi:uroporphyrinogen-III synthase